MSQKGLAPLLLILLAALGVIIYLIISYSAPFKDKLFSFLYPKPSSLAAQVAPSVPDEILIKFKAGVNEKSKDNIRKEHGLEKEDEIKQIGVERLKVNPEVKDKIIEALSHNPKVKYTEVNFIAKSEESPNDPEYTGGRQWAVNKLSMPVAWDISTGSTSTIVAVVDSGYTSHPDLEGKVLPGFNYLTNTTDVTDLSGHGTGISGIIGALTNNGVGIAGICRLCPILPLKFLDDSTLSGTYYNAAQATIYAVDHGAKVINMSFGGSTSDTTLQSAINYAWNKGVISVAAAGNYATIPILYPASEPVVIAAGSSDSSDSRWTGTNYGSGLDVMAPGTGDRTTNVTGSYYYASGTSYAAPHVAGLAALILSANPSLTPQQITGIITSTSDKITNGCDVYDSNGWSQYCGYGRINTYSALQKATGIAPPPPDTISPTVSITSPSSGSSVSNLVDINVSASDNVGVTKVDFFVDGVLLGLDISSPYLASLDTTTLVNGFNHTLTAKAYDNAGNIGTSSSVTVTVNNPIPTPSPSLTPQPTSTSNPIQPSPTPSDTTAPSLSITSPLNGGTVKLNSKVNITASASDNVGVSKVEFYVNNTLKCTVLSGSYSCIWAVPVRKNISYTIKVIAYDQANNSTPVSITVKAQ